MTHSGGSRATSGSSYLVASVDHPRVIELLEYPPAREREEVCLTGSVLFYS